MSGNELASSLSGKFAAWWYKHFSADAKLEIMMPLMGMCFNFFLTWT